MATATLPRREAGWDQLSHELRTPLHVILGHAQALEAAGFEDLEAAAHVRGLRAGAEHLLALIDGLLSSVGMGGQAPVVEGVDLHQLVADLDDFTRYEARRKGLQGEARVLPGVPRLVRLAPVPLRQILLNLLGNAIKFTARGRVDLRVAVLDGARLRFQVIDTGPGISLSEQAVVFEPLVQGAAGRRHGGTGLGLAVARRLADQLGGALHLRSGAGEGCVFSLELPLVEAEGRPERATGEGLRLVRPAGDAGKVWLLGLAPEPVIEVLDSLGLGVVPLDAPAELLLAGAAVAEEAERLARSAGIPCVRVEPERSGFASRLRAALAETIPRRTALRPAAGPRVSGLLAPVERPPPPTDRVLRATLDALAACGQRRRILAYGRELAARDPGAAQWIIERMAVFDYASLRAWLAAPQEVL